MADFSDLVEQYGSVSAALAATGHEKGEDGSWHKTETERTLNDNGYDDSVDYSVALEQAKNTGASQSVINQLETERNNKIAHQYGGKEPTMYGSQQTYTQLSTDRDFGGDTSGASQSAIDSALRFSFYDGANHGGANSTYKDAYTAAAAGDWDKVGTLVNKLMTPDGDMTEANRYMGELQKLFGYDAETYYNQLYDKVHGAGSAAAFDATGGAIKTYSDLVAAVGTSAAQQIVAQRNSKNTENPSAVLDLTTMLGVGGLTQPGGTSTGSVGDLVNPYGGGDYSDMTAYLEAMYGQNLQAELAALKSAYDSNVAELESQNDKIAEQYRAARNQVAGQNALETQRMNEIGIAQGLNTGATGQMALAQNMAYQGNLGNLWAQEAKAQSDVDLLRAQLEAEYNGNVQQTTAKNNAAMMEAIYNELIRAQEQAYQQSVYQQQLALEQQESARENVMTMLSGGVMPDSAMLAAAGMSADEALLWQALANGGSGVQDSGTPTTPSREVARTPVSPIDNGGLTTEQIESLQKLYGATPDGLWGANSTAAAGGRSALEAWNESGIMNAIEQQVGMNRTANGQAIAIQKLYESGQITEAQANSLIAKFGLA